MAGTERRSDSTRLHRAALILGAGLVLTLAVMPFDAALLDAARSLEQRLGGDVRRELVVLGQFGAPVSLIVTALLIWRLDPRRARRIGALAIAAVACWAVVQAGKMLVGRPRPKFDDPWAFAGPFGAYPIGPEEGVHHAWELWAGISSDLWAMPSSHTSAAVVLGCFLGIVYRRLWPVVVPIMAGVGLTRVLFGAHWPSDVIAGAAIAAGLTILLVRPEPAEPTPRERAGEEVGKPPAGV